MSLETRVAAFAAAVGADMKTVWTLLNNKQSDLTALTTTNKTNLVAALNEINSAIGALIDDASSSSSTSWSSVKIQAQINAAVSALVDGAPGALDTLNEIAAALNDNPSVIQNIINAQAKRVAVDQVQSFTTAEKLQGCSNLGIGNPETDFTAAYTTARDAA